MWIFEHSDLYLEIADTFMKLLFFLLILLAQTFDNPRNIYPQYHKKLNLSRIKTPQFLFSDKLGLPCLISPVN